MIKSDHGKVIISGDIGDILAEYGMLSEKLIISVPEEMKMPVAGMLTKMLKIAVEKSMERRCEDAGNETVNGGNAEDPG